MYLKNANNGRHMEKRCCKCKQLQPLTCFGKLSSSKDGHRYDCNTCRRDYRNSTKDHIKRKNQMYYDENKVELLEKHRQRWTEKKDMYNEQRKQYRQRPKVKEHIQMKNKEYLEIQKQKIKDKRENDLNFRIGEVLRSKIHKMVKGSTTSYANLIGCDHYWLKAWIEYRWQSGMSWENFGSYWQIDHILPITAFDFSKSRDQKTCFHWTNLQPLSSQENRSKSNKLFLHMYINNIVSVIRFNNKYKTFLGYQNIRESLCWLREKLRYGNNPTDDEVNNLGNGQSAAKLLQSLPTRPWRRFRD